MKILILTVGSRGDVQPFLALAKGLAATGHSIRFAAHSNFRDAVESQELEFFPLAGDSEKLFASDAGIRYMETGANPFLCFPRWFGGVLGGVLEQLMEDCWRASEGCDAVIGAATTPWAPDIAIARNVPFIHAALWPIYASTEYQPFLIPSTFRLPKFLRVFMHNLLGLQLWLYIRKPLNRLRTSRMGLPPAKIPEIARDNWRWLHGIVGVSPQLFARPADWPPHTMVTGSWLQPPAEDYTPTADLQRFLDSGSPPVCVGFGSAIGRNPAAAAKAVIDALQSTGQRGILLTGWGGLKPSNLPPEVLAIESIPHSWLFPRVAAVVTAGGAGTLWEVLRAGIPPIIVPFCTDQSFWGSRVAKLGIGPQPIPAQQLSASRLAAAIDEALKNGDMRRRAAELGAKVRTENGIAVAVEFIERHLAQSTVSGKHPVSSLADRKNTSPPATTEIQP